MKKTIIASLLATALIGGAFAIQPVKAVDYSQEKGTMTVTFSIEKEVSPDTAEVSIAVKTSDKKSMQIAATKNKEISGKIYEYLKSNINTNNGDYIKTANYSAQPIYTWCGNKKELNKYEVSNNIIVHTKSLDKIGTFIDKSLEMGATNVNSLNFTLSNKDELCTNMLSQAAKQVRTRANAVATSAGSGIIGVKNIHTSCSANQNRPNYAYARNMMMAKAAMADGAVTEEAPAAPIEAGNVKVYASVDTTFFLR